MSTAAGTTTAQVDAATRAGILIEALPYLQEFRDAVVVVKYGGNAMGNPALAEQFAADVVLLQAVGLKPVVVHGGGPQIGALMQRLGMEPVFRDGHRVTDADTLDIARMVLVGKVNRDIVSSINRHGPIAVGLSGEDASLIVAEARDPELGFVGNVDTVNPRIISDLIDDRLVPVLSTIGSDDRGQAYNINADAVAGAVAGALEAEKLIYLTDVTGLLDDVGDPDTLIHTTTVAKLRVMVAEGRVAGGMIPKIDACLKAVERGVGSAHILDGRVPHVVLLELFTDHGVGTMITRHGPEVNR